MSTPNQNLPDRRTRDVFVKINGVRVKAGTVSYKVDGWWFLPHFQCKPSRVSHLTPEAAVRNLKDFELVPR